MPTLITFSGFNELISVTRWYRDKTTFLYAWNMYLFQLDIFLYFLFDIFCKMFMQKYSVKLYIFTGLKYTYIHKYTKIQGKYVLIINNSIKQSNFWYKNFTINSVSRGWLKSITVGILKFKCLKKMNTSPPMTLNLHNFHKFHVLSSICVQEPRFGQFKQHKV